MSQAEEDCQKPERKTAAKICAEEDARTLDQIQGDFLFPHQQESLTRQILPIREVDRSIRVQLILPVLKDTFYLQVLRKAQECVRTK